MTSESRAEKLSELGALAVLLTSFGLILVSVDRPLPFSDPTTWYAFGMTFVDSFGTEPLAYLFPLYLAAAIAIAGPVFGFLANIPVLVALAAVLYGFVRRISASQSIAPIAATAALAWLIAIDQRPLVVLSSPYRDPLSHVLILIASGLLVAVRTHTPDNWIPAAGSGLCLALAASVRETSILMLVPFLVYALASRRDDRTLGFWRPGSVFAAGFSLGIAPLLMQNFAISGNPFVPGQSAASMGASGVLFGNLGWNNFPTGFPLVLESLASHYGILSGVLIALGTVFAARRRLGAVLTLLLPALATYIVFWSCYPRSHAFARYLFIVDLLVAPLVGLGVAAVAELAAGQRDGSRRQTLARFTAHAAGFLLALAAMWGLLSVDPAISATRFRLAHAERIRADILDWFPPGAHIVSAYPVGEMMMTFGSDHLRLFGVRTPMRHLADALDGGNDVYLISFEDMLADEKRRLAGALAIERVRSFAAQRWGTGRRSGEQIYIDRVRARGLVPKSTSATPSRELVD